MEGDEKPEFWLIQNSYAHLAKVAKMTTRYTESKYEERNRFISN